MSTDDDTTIINGDRFRIARRAARLSQAELSERIGVHQGHISAIELGKRMPSIDVLKRIAAVLGVSVHWLTGNPAPVGAGPEELSANHILADGAAPQGLVALAGDIRLVAGLKITPQEWGALRSLHPPGDLSKDAYIMILLAIRTTL